MIRFLRLLIKLGTLIDKPIPLIFPVPGRFTGLCLWPFILYQTPEARADCRLVEHERVHWREQRNFLLVPGVNGVLEYLNTLPESLVYVHDYVWLLSVPLIPWLIMYGAQWVLAKGKWSDIPMEQRAERIATEKCVEEV